MRRGMAAGVALASIASFAWMASLDPSVHAQSSTRVEVGRAFRVGDRFALAWRHVECDELDGSAASASAAPPRRSLRATVTVAAVDGRTTGEPTTLDFAIEASSAPPRSPVPAPGSAIRYERMSATEARRGHVDWRGSNGLDEVSLTILRYAFPRASERALGTRRPVAIGASWSLRGLEHREGLPVARGALRGTVRLDAVRDTPRAYVLSVDAALGRPLPLFRGDMYREQLLARMEHHVIVVPADRSLPWERIAVKLETVRSTNAPPLEAIRAGAVAPVPREVRASRCDVIEMSPLSPGTPPP